MFAERLGMVIGSMQNVVGNIRNKIAQTVAVTATRISNVGNEVIVYNIVEADVNKAFHIADWLKSQNIKYTTFHMEDKNKKSVIMFNIYCEFEAEESVVNEFLTQKKYIYTRKTI